MSNWFRKRLKLVDPEAAGEEDRRSERITEELDKQLNNLKSATAILNSTIDRLVAYEADKRGDGDGGHGLRDVR